MIDVEPLIRAELERAVPEPSPGLADWDDVRSRAGLPSGRRARARRLAVAALAAAVFVAVFATPLGGAISRTLGGFSDWLTGQPGEPAPPSEQRRFEEAGERSWAAFPKKPELRELLRVRAGAASYVLYGFRSGNAICLRLSVRGLRRAGPVLACAARAELERSRDPVVPVKANVSLGWVGDPPVAAQALVSFGFVAAGIRAVELGPAPGATTPATVANGAFLHVVDQPSGGGSMRIGIAAGPGGRTERFPLAVMRSGEESGATALPPQGPAKVERVVTGGTVGWFARREPRGQSLPADLRRQLSQFRRIRIGRFARVIQPDPADFLRLVVAERAGRPNEICMYLLTRGGIGGGCNPIGQAFARGPLLASWGFSGAGQQFWTFQAVATDLVARVEVFLATGERRPLPFRDNVVLGRIPPVKMPARVVAYDADGRVIGVWTIRGPRQ